MVRDDVVEYSLDAHHSEEEGKKIRKKIAFVTVILSVVTIVEVAVGIYFPKSELSIGGWWAVKIGYIILTVVKAGYIIMVFMHLGDEHRNLRRMILWPYIIFILYLIFILSVEAIAINDAWTNLR
ncbi:MAG: cytochrome C oxidase subunit IV family protein [Crocinitomicaceae bacterium]|nr:cytochrome C oxidase subunit IV family protein [Crocinitomicaceae bacterium]